MQRLQQRIPPFNDYFHECKNWVVPSSIPSGIRFFRSFPSQPTSTKFLIPPKRSAEGGKFSAVFPNHWTGFPKPNETDSTKTDRIFSHNFIYHFAFRCSIWHSTRPNKQYRLLQEGKSQSKWVVGPLHSKERRLCFPRNHLNGACKIRKNCNCHPKKQPGCSVVWPPVHFSSFASCTFWMRIFEHNICVRRSRAVQQFVSSEASDVAKSTLSEANKTHLNIAACRNTVLIGKPPLLWEQYNGCCTADDPWSTIVLTGGRTTSNGLLQILTKHGSQSEGVGLIVTAYQTQHQDDTFIVLADFLDFSTLVLCFRLLNVLKIAKTWKIENLQRKLAEIVG